MSLVRGTKLGPYEIQTVLAAGGMGEVYRSWDTRLDRVVAIKVLPESFASDAERLRRFEQEAKAVAGLNHPNILSVYDIGLHNEIRYIVTELLEGQTLREKLGDGALPFRGAVDYAVQIAQGLAAAHDKGVVHRDLKPENLFVTEDGRVKILDFGLAKQSRPPAPAAGGVLTLDGALTTAGLVLGTVGYMSPEQVRGQAVDHRSDIFSLGIILYETLTGTPAFHRTTAAETLAAILNEDPPSISALQPAVPSGLDRLIKTCLAKRPTERWRDAYDLKFALEWIKDEEPRATTASQLSGGTTGAVACEVQAHILPPEKSAFLFMGPNAGPVALSPDGRRIAFTASQADGTHLFIRAIDSAVAKPLAGTEGATFPFWSPDSRSVGFFADGNLRRIEALGGPPQTLGYAPFGRGGSWNREGVIIFVPSPTSPIFCVPAAGGSPRPVTTLDPSHITTHKFPCFLPDGRHFLYFGGHPFLEGGIYVGCLEGNEQKPLLRGYLNGAYAPPGFLLFVRDGTLLARRFDVQRLEAVGEDFPVAEHVMVDTYVQRALFSVSENGILAYHRGTVASLPRLAWFHRNRKQATPLNDQATYVSHQLSPDGRRLAGTDRLGGLSSVWVFDLGRKTKTRLTFDHSSNIRVIWFPDGKKVIFSSNRKGLFHIYQKASNGAGEEELLFDSGADERAESCSADGKYLAYLRRDANQQGAADIWVLPLAAHEKAFPLIESKFEKSFPSFSPDGRWMAYASNESGRFEIYVVAFPGAKGKWQVSSSGGTFPRWRGDGKELFYLGPDNRLRVVGITASRAGLRVGASSILFSVQAVPPPACPFDVTSDGTRFLVNAMPPTVGNPEPVTLLVNWDKRLK